MWMGRLAVIFQRVPAAHGTGWEFSRTCDTPRVRADTAASHINAPALIANALEHTRTSAYSHTFEAAACIHEDGSTRCDLSAGPSDPLPSLGDSSAARHDTHAS